MSCYSVYFDETGDFQGKEPFYAICGFVWEGTPETLTEKLKEFCTQLSDWLIQEHKDNGLPRFQSLHTTENQDLKELLRNHDSASDILHTRLKDLPIYITAIYAYKNETDTNDFFTDDLYRKMNRTIIRQITRKIRKNAPESKITFHIPTRDTVFDKAERSKKEFFKQSDILINQDGQKLRAKMNSSDTFIDVQRDLNVICTCRTISYSMNPDDDDAFYHQLRNSESTAWGYFTADIICSWIRSFAIDKMKDPHTLETEISNLIKTFLLSPYSKNIERAANALDHIHENPCEYLRLLNELHKIANPSPRTRYAIDLMENPNPFADLTLIKSSYDRIENDLIYSSKYSEAKVLLERIKSLCEKTETKGSRPYCDVVSRLMTCHHHEGGIAKAQELFNEIISTVGRDQTYLMDICNKYQEVFVNSLAFEEGIHFMDDVLKKLQPASVPATIGNMSLPGPNMTDEEKAIQAKATSSLGSLHAYLGHSDQANAHFQDSINKFTEIGQTDNAQISRVHQALLLLDSEPIESAKILTVLDSLFCPKGKTAEINPSSYELWEKWLDGIITQGTDENGEFHPGDVRFLFWVWLRAIDKVPPEILRSHAEFQKIPDKYPQYPKMLSVNDHPAQMIRKYDAIYMLKIGKNEAAKKDLAALESLIHCNREYGIIPLLCRMAIYEIKSAMNSLTVEEQEKLEAEVKKDIENLYQNVRQNAGGNITESLIDRLYKKGSVRLSDLKKSLRYEFR